MVLAVWAAAPARHLHAEEADRGDETTTAIHPADHRGRLMEQAEVDQDAAVQCGASPGRRRCASRAPQACRCASGPHGDGENLGAAFVFLGANDGLHALIGGNR